MFLFFQNGNRSLAQVAEKLIIEKRTKVDINAAKQSYKQYETVSYGFVIRKHTSADELKKIKCNGFFISTMTADMDNVIVEHCTGLRAGKSDQHDRKAELLNSYKQPSTELHYKPLTA